MLVSWDIDNMVWLFTHGEAIPVGIICFAAGSAFVMPSSVGEDDQVCHLVRSVCKEQAVDHAEAIVQR